ncbi:MAG TPA: tetratricopeptide repeat protein [Actinomycetes bacterium]|nr:tetratricopeptide repeat protein [Actinomycetes bacterium]
MTSGDGTSTPGGGLVEQAGLLIDAGRHADALERLDRAGALQPDDLRVHRLRALALHHMARHAEALQAAETACALAPDDAWAHRLRSIALLGTGRRPEALAAIHESLRIDPDDHHSLSMAVTAELANGRPGQAWAAAARCLQLAPDDAVAHDAVGEVAIATRSWRDAELAYRNVLGMAPTSAWALNNLGVIRSALGDDEGALQLYARSLVTDPSLHLARGNLRDTADRFLWGRRFRLPRTPGMIVWLLLCIPLAPVGVTVAFLLYLLWFPARAVRAWRRWPRIPERARDLVRGEQRRRALDAAASWGLTVSVVALLLWTAWGPAALRAGIAGRAAGLLALAVAVAGVGVSLSRVIPRVLRLDWPTRRRGTSSPRSPFEQTVRV